jgi:fatty-acyl-CoA synthase
VSASTVAELVLGRRGDDRPGLWFEDSRWTWAEVVEAAAVRAELLHARRRPGPFHVGVLLDNVPEYLFVLGGAALAGATVVGLNPTRRGDPLARDVRHTDCQLVLTDRARQGDLDALDLGAATGHVLAVEDEPHRGLDPVDPAATPLPTPEDLWLLIFTSGSTGDPKAVRMSHGRAAGIVGNVVFRPRDVLYSAMPLYHGNALNAAVLPALASGAQLVLRRRFSASGFLPDVRRYGATFFNTVGRALGHINATEPTPDDRDHSLRWVLAPEASEEDRARFTTRFGPPVFTGYGSSENAIVLHPASTSRPGALGVAPPGADIAVVDPDSREERAVARFDEHGGLTNAEDAIGELVGRNVVAAFEGYYGDPDADAQRTRDGWYWSGDLAYRDEDGVFYFAGRTGDWLRVDSENLAAGPIETVLSRWPDASAVAVYPVPDVSTADQVMAAVELARDVGFDPDRFAAFLADQPDLGTKWAPRYVRIVDGLPLTATHKVDRRPLREEGWRTTDEVWHRPARAEGYVLLTAADRASLDAALAVNGRAHLLPDATPAVVMPRDQEAVQPRSHLE